MEMIFLANESVAREWVAESPETREIFDLPSAVDFPQVFSCLSPGIAGWPHKTAPAWRAGWDTATVLCMWC